MSKKINYWSDVPGKIIDSVTWTDEGTHLWFEFEDEDLEVESVAVGMKVQLRPVEAIAHETEPFDSQTLVGLTVERVDVPYLAEGVQGDAFVILTFDEGPAIALSSADATVPVRIS